MNKKIKIYVTSYGTVSSKNTNFNEIKIKDFLKEIETNSLDATIFHLDKISDYDYILDLNSRQYEIILKTIEKSNLTAKYNYNCLITMLLKYKKINYKLTIYDIFMLFSSVFSPIFLGLILENNGILLANLSIFSSLLIIFMPFLILQIIGNVLQQKLIKDMYKEIKEKANKYDFGKVKNKAIDLLNNKLAIIEVKSLTENRILKKIIELNKITQNLNNQDKIIITKKLKNILLEYKDKLDLIPDFATNNNLEINNIRKIENSILQILNLLEKDIFCLLKESNALNLEVSTNMDIDNSSDFQYKKVKK